MVAGGTAPATNFTRQDVHRPRPPQVAVTSTPAACAALRMLVPGVIGNLAPRLGAARLDEEGEEHGHAAPL